MLWKQVEPHAAECCRRLWQAGFEAYPVGGCVRDLLLGRIPGDWDVTTNALPEQVIDLFEHVIATGVKHGTVTVVLGDEHIEVTTFRTEDGYSDGRHPDAVRFDAGLEEDLSRRDFTINAMALGPEGEVVDLFGGQKDLSEKVIRCVGDPVRRFGEDGLRMFRAVRFGAQLGFELTEETVQAIKCSAFRAENIAAERVRTEVEKILCSDRPERMSQLFSFGLLGRWAQGCPTNLSCLSQLSAQPVLRWAKLCALLTAGNCVDSVEVFLRGLKLDGHTIRSCSMGHILWQEGLPQTDLDWRRALAEYGDHACRAAAAMGGALEKLEQVLKQSPCVSVGGLDLSGHELAERGLHGAQIGMAQRYLLEHVLIHPGDNRAEILRLKAKEFAGRQH